MEDFSSLSIFTKGIYKWRRNVRNWKRFSENPDTFDIVLSTNGQKILNDFTRKVLCQ